MCRENRRRKIPGRARKKEPEPHPSFTAPVAVASPGLLTGDAEPTAARHSTGAANNPLALGQRLTPLTAR